MKSLCILLIGITCVFCDYPTLKNCDNMGPTAATGEKIILDGGPDGDEYFTPKTKLTVNFNIKKTFAADAMAHVKLDVQKYIFFGYVSIPNWVYNLAVKAITLPPGLKHVKDNVFSVTCEALTAKKITDCPPKVGDGVAFVDFGPVFAQQKKLVNSLVGRFIGQGSFKIHAEATVMKDGDNSPYPLVCVDVTATTKIPGKK